MTPSPPEASGTPRALQLLRAALPHIVTALAAVALTLLLVLVLRPIQPAYVLPQRPTAAPTATQPPQPSSAPTAPLPQPDERVLAQEILDLRVRLDQTWSSVYITRAALQIADAEVALRVNDAAEVERLLAAADASLALAYERSDQVNRGPLGELRAQLGQLRDDIHVLPEGLDQRLKSLRQVMMTLIEET